MLTSLRRAYAVLSTIAFVSWLVWSAEYVPYVTDQGVISLIAWFPLAHVPKASTDGQFGAYILSSVRWTIFGVFTVNLAACYFANFAGLLFMAILGIITTCVAGNYFLSDGSFFGVNLVIIYMLQVPALILMALGLGSMALAVIRSS